MKCFGPRAANSREPSILSRPGMLAKALDWIGFARTPARCAACVFLRFCSTRNASSHFGKRFRRMAYGSRSEPGLEMSGASSELVSGPWSRASSRRRFWNFLWCSTNRLGQSADGVCHIEQVKAVFSRDSTTLSSWNRSSGCGSRTLYRQVKSGNVTNP